MKLSVVILNYNVHHFLELCLESVQAALASTEAEIIVVDNASDDASCEFIKSRFPEIILIENQENHGFSKGNNIGVKQARGEFICILNPDTVVPENAFSNLLDYAESLSDLGILGCQLIDGRGRFLPESKRNIPYPWVALRKLIGRSKAYYATQLHKDQTGQVGILVGAFMIIRRSVFWTVGGFDEDYFMYGEDIDLSYKVLQSGFQNYYNGQISVIHFKGESTLKDANYARRFYGAMQIFYEKHFKQHLLLNALVILGIKLAHLHGRSGTQVKSGFEQTYVFTKNTSVALSTQSHGEVSISSDLSEDVTDNSLVVYDFRSFSIKAVITDMKRRSNQVNIFFRFIPKNGTFMLGSDSALTRGDVQHF